MFVKISSFIKDDEFFDKLGEYQLDKHGPAALPT